MNLLKKLGNCLPASGLICASALLMASAWAQAGDYQNHPQTQAFIQELVQNDGFDASQLAAVFAKAERKQSILDAISRPAEKVKPWKDYRPLFITESRIAQGVDFWRKHQVALARAEAEYGVPAQIIAAIIGIETFYGANTGRFRVIDALSTLAFDYPPRAPFFRQQLREYLLLVREQQQDPLTLTGSYAGAMGWPQFMPGSFRAYAVDFDQDGRIDIWNNPADAIGSVASYFKHHGWQAGQAVVSAAHVVGDNAAQGISQSIEPSLSMGELKVLGWSTEQNVPDAQKVTAFRFDGKNGAEYWVGLNNFYAITRYNRSFMYAMAVYQLSEALVAARGPQ